MAILLDDQSETSLPPYKHREQIVAAPPIAVELRSQKGTWQVNMHDRNWGEPAQDDDIVDRT
jgi:hypothetical protein